MESILTFNGHDYRIPTLASNLGPMIEVKPEELNSFDAAVFPEGVVSYQEDKIGIDPLFVVFYKQHGRYTVLMGRGHPQFKPELGAESFRGRLISSPSLKKARIEVLTPAEQKQIEDLAASINERRHSGNRSRSDHSPRDRSQYQRDNEFKRSFKHQ